MTVQHDSAQGTTATRRSHTALALEDKFEILKDDIGDGSFGSVALARVRTAGAHVARRGTTVEPLWRLENHGDAFGGPALANGFLVSLGRDQDDEEDV